MDFRFIWKAIVIVIGGILILRFAGRKSISQLTVAQTVMMVAVGSLIIQPVGDRNIWITMVITFLMVLTLISIEYIVLKSDHIETFLYGKSMIVVENGQINVENLRKLRLSVDMLELRLRQLGIPKITDLQWATIESNGQLGYMLKPCKQFATKEDIDRLVTLITTNMAIPADPLPVTETTNQENLFTEVKNKEHIKDFPEHLN